MSKHSFAALALVASFCAHAGTVQDFSKPTVPGARAAPVLPGAPQPVGRPPNQSYANVIPPADAVAPAGPAPARDKAGVATITGVSFTYDQAGNRKTMTLTNGVVTEYFYDGRNRLRELHTTKDGVTLQRHIYALDASGLREGIRSIEADGTERTIAYGYDKADRLTSEVQTAGGVEVFNASYVYDKVGNRESAVVNGVTTTYSYNKNDWLMSETTVGGQFPGTTTYTYDDNGNRLTKSGPLGSIEYVYNDANRMVELREGLDRISYAYNADGLLVSKAFFKPGLPVLTQRYVWDANSRIPQIMEELVSTNGGAPQVVANYLFADDLIAQTRNGVTSFVVADGMGSTRALTDTGGAITDTFRYDAFGNVIGRTGSSPADHLYRGEQLDPNAGFYYLRARWMDPGIGRFTQMDTFAGFSSDPPSLHKYLYANADPVNGSDPTGHMTMMDMSAAQRTMGQLLTRAISTTNYVSRAQTGIGVVQSLGDAFKLLTDPSALSVLQTYLDPKNPDFQGTLSGEAFEHAVDTLRANAPRIARSVAMHKWKTFADRLPRKDSSIIFYMPTPIATPGNAKMIPTGIRIPLANFGSRPLVLAFGGHSTRFFGVGLGIGTRANAAEQLFRMDWAGAGSHYPGDAKNHDYWRDPGFEFHVPKGGM